MSTEPQMSKWRTSETTGKLMALLAEVQGELRPAHKDATNPHFGKSYASLDSIIEVCKEPLSSRGIVRLQPAWSDDPGSVVVTTRLQHGEEWVEADLTMPVDKRNAQAVGSATTYGRRYGLSSMLGISVGGDDDGNGATASTPDEPTCETAAPDLADKNKAMCDELADLDEVDRITVWNWACGKAGVPRDGGAFPGPKALYVDEGRRVARLLEGALAIKKKDGEPDA